MPKIYFVERRAEGEPDSYSSLFIPTEGELPSIPFKWGGRKCEKSTVYSRKKRPQVMRRKSALRKSYPSVMKSIHWNTIRWNRMQWNTIRKFPAIISHSATLASDWMSTTTERVVIVWIKERQEWVAYQENWRVDRSDNYGFRDEYVSLEGPWSLDETHKRALLTAYDALGRFDVLEANRIPPERLLVDG